MAKKVVNYFSDQTWKGSAGKDYIMVKSGTYNAAFDSGAGDDAISINGAQSSKIYGGAGNDSIKVDWQDYTKNVLLDGGTGNDMIDVDGTNSTVLGGAGNDKISVKGNNWTVNGGNGNDTIQIWGWDKNITVTGGAGKDTFTLMTPRMDGLKPVAGKWVTLTDLSSEDVLRFAINPEYARPRYYPGSRKPNPYYKQDGSIQYLTAKRSGSTITLTGNRYGVNITLKNVTDLNKIANVKVYNGSKTTTLRKLIKVSALPAGIQNKNNQLVISNSYKKTFALENYVSWSKDITAVASKQKLTIKGDGRANAIMAGNAGSVLYGLGGNDKLIGGTGIDILYAGAGNDTLKGGKGNDKLYAQSGNNVLYGEAGNDTLEGGSGTDTLRGGLGADTIKCGKGMDKIQFYKGDGNDTIQNGAKNDILYLYNISNLKAQAKLKMSGKNLVMNFTTNKNDSITITNWSANGLSKVVAGGTTYHLTQSGNTVTVK